MTFAVTRSASTMGVEANAWDTLRSSLPLTTSARQEQRRLLTDPKVVRLTLHSSEIHMLVPSSEPSWLYDVLGRIQHLSRLKKDWDSYGGETPTDESIYAALVVMSLVLKRQSPAPAIVPLSEGGIQIEWQGDGEELEIRVGSTGLISAFRFDEQAGKGYELDDVSLADLSSLLKLTGQR